MAPPNTTSESIAEQARSLKLDVLRSIAVALDDILSQNRSHGGDLFPGGVDTVFIYALALKLITEEEHQAKRKGGNGKLINPKELLAHCVKAVLDEIERTEGLAKIGSKA